MDETLKELLQPPADVQVTFLNIQKFINPHYIKEEKPEAPAKEKKAAAPAKEEEKPVVKKPTVKKPVAKA
jgi:hypothetical protein